MRYQVTVGNIGKVYDGNSFRKAHQAFAEYVRQSRDGYGRAAGESVTFWQDGEPTGDWIGDGDREADL